MKILLHMCCGPCSCYPVKKLRAAGHELTGYFFNPNIHPYREFKHRLETAQEFAEKVDMPIVVDKNYILQTFLQRALTAQKREETLYEKPRCRMCYSWRLHQAALYAKENGFDAFTSTLFVSTYQLHDMMKNIAQKIAKAVDIPFFYDDFRIGWAEGVEICKSMDLYRQPYCGCIFSEEERYNNHWKKEHKKKMKRLRLKENEILLLQEERTNDCARSVV